MITTQAHFIAWASRIINAGLAFFYPEICQICRRERAGPSESFLCARCRRQVRLIERPFCERCGYPYPGQIDTPFECGNCRGLDYQFTSARSAAVAQAVLREVIHRYKYHRAFWFEPFLAELLVLQASTELNAQRWDWLVPVPLHPLKRREREFNQAERLAFRLGRATGLPVSRRLLSRTRPTLTQTRLSREERLKNVSAAFQVARGTQLNGERLVLVDDVFTTGATTNACAAALIKAGAGEVCVWTVARGI